MDILVEAYQTSGMIIKRGVAVCCNNFEYKFDAEDKGGKMTVKFN